MSYARRRSLRITYPLRLSLVVDNIVTGTQAGVIDGYRDVVSSLQMPPNEHRALESVRAEFVAELSYSSEKMRIVAYAGVRFSVARAILPRALTWLVNSGIRKIPAYRGGGVGQLVQLTSGIDERAFDYALVTPLGLGPTQILPADQTAQPHLTAAQ